jgi:hypothetical protein
VGSSSFVLKSAMLLHLLQMLRQTTMSKLSCCLDGIICVLLCYAPRDSLHGFRACEPSNLLGAPKAVALSRRPLKPSRHRTPANIGSGSDRPAGRRAQRDRRQPARDERSVTNPAMCWRNNSGDTQAKDTAGASDRVSGSHAQGQQRPERVVTGPAGV